MKICNRCRHKFVPTEQEKTYCSLECRQLTVEYNKKYDKEYYIKNKQEHLKYLKKYQQEHKKELSLYIKNYRRIHKKELLEKKKLYHQKRRKEDINFKILTNLRSRITDVLRNNSKSMKTIELLGCSIDFLKQYLKSKFTADMTWSNYGNGWHGRGNLEWHIDHIIPCASFDLSLPEEQRKCFHYTNLQPLWAKDNLIKSDKL